MKNMQRTCFATGFLGLLLASCSTMQSTAVRDDVYFMPSEAPAMASIAPAAPQAITPPTEDYYDAGTSQQLGTDRTYYDMTYNDPYYYNYGRFGFGSGMGMGMGMGSSFGNGFDNGIGFGSGWFMGPRGFPMRWGYGSGVYSGWSMGGGMGGWGYGGMNDPFYNGAYGPMGWNNGYGWNYGYYNPYNSGGYGCGNYYGPYGNCASCYQPVVFGGGRSVVVGHRSSTGIGNSARSAPGATRLAVRDPIRLSPSTDPVKRDASGTFRNSGLDRTRELRMNDTERRTDSRNSGTRSVRSPERNIQDRSSPGVRSSPSIGGGTRTSPASGGGGTRTSPGRR